MSGSLHTPGSEEHWFPVIISLALLLSVCGVPLEAYLDLGGSFSFLSGVSPAHPQIPEGSLRVKQGLREYITVSVGGLKSL